MRLPLELPRHLAPALLEVVDQAPEEHRVRLGLVARPGHPDNFSGSVRIYLKSTLRDPEYTDLLSL